MHLSGQPNTLACSLQAHALLSSPAASALGGPGAERAVGGCEHGAGADFRWASFTRPSRKGVAAQPWYSHLMQTTPPGSPRARGGGGVAVGRRVQFTPTDHRCYTAPSVEAARHVPPSTSARPSSAKGSPLLRAASPSLSLSSFMRTPSSAPARRAGDRTGGPRAHSPAAFTGSIHPAAREPLQRARTART